MTFEERVDFLARLFEEYGELLHSPQRRRRRRRWLKFFIKSNISKTVKDIHLKLETLTYHQHLH